MGKKLLFSPCPKCKAYNNPLNKALIVKCCQCGHKYNKKNTSSLYQELSDGAFKELVDDSFEKLDENLG